MPEPGEPDLPRLNLVDSAIIPHAKSPRVFHSTQRLDIETGPGSSGLLSERFEGFRKPPLDFPGETTELALRTRLEEDFRRHGGSQPQPLADLAPWDVWLLAQPSEVFTDERPGRAVVHQFVQDVVVRGAPDLVEAETLQCLRLYRNGCRGHTITTIIAIILIPDEPEP